MSPEGGPTGFSTTAPGELRFWGVPVVYDSNFNTNIGSSKHAIAGDWARRRLFRGMDFRIDSSDQAGTRWDQNLVGFRAKERSASTHGPRYTRGPLGGLTAHPKSGGVREHRFASVYCSRVPEPINPGAWLHLTDADLEYHRKQWSTVYRSTVAFEDWLDSIGCIGGSQRVLDIATGGGANVAYLAARHPACEFVGIDLNAELIAFGNERLKELDRANATLETADLFELPARYVGAFDGVVSLQTLSWLPDYEDAVRAMAALSPSWIALSSLFYEGEVRCNIQVRDYSARGVDRPYKESYYNVYPLPLVVTLFEELGFTRFDYVPFEIDVDLPRPARLGMGTYTERLDDGRRIQRSGPLLMPWYFICARR